MTNLEQYAQSVSLEKWFEYFFCRGCNICPAKEYCHAQPEGTCCRENFRAWAGMEANHKAMMERAEEIAAAQGGSGDD